MENLTAETFRSKVFDYRTEKEWKFAGAKPCIVDFYADWCGPCKMLSPVLAELAKKYDGKIDIYKVNTEQEPELSGVFGIQSIPTLLFVPQTGKPSIAQGALPADALEKVVNEFLLGGKNG